jgi:hypothetical protein
MKSLFMIRLENGNSVVLQATDREQALEFAGLRIDPAKQAAAVKDRDVAAVHLALVDGGYGPQRFTIREIESFHCVANLEDNGNFLLRIESGECSDEFCLDYPYLCEAEREHFERQFPDPNFTNPEVRKLYQDAVERERMRLLISN